MGDEAARPGCRHTVDHHAERSADETPGEWFEAHDVVQEIEANGIPANPHKYQRPASRPPGA